MAGLDDLMAQIPVADIASKIGADEGEVNAAIQQLVPALVGGVHANVQDDQIDSAKLEEAVESPSFSSLLDGGVNVDDVDEHEGDQIVSRIFGGNNSESVASALAGGGAAVGGGLVQKLLPILAPIVLAYIGKQFANRGAAQQGEAAAGAQASGGGLGDILGSILGGGAQTGGNNPLGSILGSVLGGGSGASNPIGEILGGLLGGKR